MLDTLIIPFTYLLTYLQTDRQTAGCMSDGMLTVFVVCTSSNDWMGPPHNADWTISDVQVDSSTEQCLGDWVCEHRWPVVKAMVEWRSMAMDSPLRHWWTDGQRQIAFSRADRAFIAINDDHSKTLDEQLQTGLPAGVYCDVISGGLADGCTRCRGRTVTGHIHSLTASSSLMLTT